MIGTRSRAETALIASRLPNNDVDWPRNFNDFKSGACGPRSRRAYRPCWRRGRVAEGGGLLNRYRVVKPYRGFESLRLRQSTPKAQYFQRLGVLTDQNRLTKGIAPGKSAQLL
jgi:hypothetical protein